MSELLRMSISGIRSYSPDEVEYIEFMKPITLIQGRNGSGKTSIIECLKVMTSGSFPPNSNKGQCMIYDPKLLNKNEVRSNIKLLFKAYNGKEIMGSK